MTSADQAPGDEGGYISSLESRRVPLTPPGPPPSRLDEARAVLAWAMASWLRPGDAAAGWEQRAGREQLDS